jgi:hypothetical protein
VAALVLALAVAGVGPSAQPRHAAAAPLAAQVPPGAGDASDCDVVLFGGTHKSPGTCAVTQSRRPDDGRAVLLR